jgi:hypothetical protein
VSDTSPLRGEVLPTTQTKRDDDSHVCNPPSPSPANKIAPYGPWSPAISHEERGKELRCLAGIVACHCGSDDPLIVTLRDAEINGAALEHAFAMFEGLPALRRRRVLATFAGIMQPGRGPR